jgi:anaphase-promoting complex subunit 10
LSSCKSGHGVENLIDNCLDTYWQSDGPQPHLVNMQFKQKTKVKDICLYADYKTDESYTPSRIVIKAGTHVNDLREIGSYDLVEPSGWIIIPLRTLNKKDKKLTALSAATDSNEDDDNNNNNNNKKNQNDYIKTWMLQLAVLANHQNGRDTHIKQIKIHSPIETTNLQPKFSVVEIGEWSTIR